MAVGFVVVNPGDGPPVRGCWRPGTAWVVVDEGGNDLPMGLVLLGDRGELRSSGGTVGAGVTIGGRSSACTLVGGVGLAVFS